MDAGQPVGCLATHRVRDRGADVPTLCDIAGVAEASHQLRPRLGDAGGTPAELPRLAGEAVAGQGRQDDVERVLGFAAVRGRLRERADGVEQFDDRPGPAVRHDQRQGVLVLRRHVQEMDVDAVDLGDVLRQRVQPRLACAPVVLGGPVADQLLDRGQLHALLPIADQLLARPAGRRQAQTKREQLFLGDRDAERADRGAVDLPGLLGGHGDGGRDRVGGRRHLRSSDGGAPRPRPAFGASPDARSRCWDWHRPADRGGLPPGGPPSAAMQAGRAFTCQPQNVWAEWD